MITSPNNTAATMEDYIVVFWSPNDHWQWSPTRVHVPEGDTVKDVQDRVAEMDQDLLRRNIYFVVPLEDYKNLFRTGYFNNTKEN